MFGDGFKPRESSEGLKNGNYLAKITKVEAKNGSYGDYLLISVQIKDHPNCNPSSFIMSDRPKTGTANSTLEECIERWERRFTSFFKAFEIPMGDFNYNGWIGKKGEVTVQPKKGSQYKELIPWEKEPFDPNTIPNATPSAVQTVANAFGGSVQPSADFPEDITF